MADLCKRSPLLWHDWSFRATPPEHSMRRLTGNRLLTIDHFALQTDEATETADANILG